MEAQLMQYEEHLLQYKAFILTYVNDDPFLLFFGCFYIILGLSAFLTPKSWEDFMDLFVENDALSLVMGILILPISLFVIFFYNDWETVGSVILMVVGYLALAKALILLLRPKWMQAVLRNEFVRKWIWLDGVSGVILGVALLTL